MSSVLGLCKLLEMPRACWEGEITILAKQKQSHRETGNLVQSYTDDK